MRRLAGLMCGKETDSDWRAKRLADTVFPWMLIDSKPASCITSRRILHMPSIPRHRLVLRIRSPFPVCATTRKASVRRVRPPHPCEEDAHAPMGSKSPAFKGRASPLTRDLCNIREKTNQVFSICTFVRQVRHAELGLPVYWASDPERLTGDRLPSRHARGCSQERFRRATGFSRAPAVHFATATTEAVSTGIEIRNV